MLCIFICRRIQRNNVPGADAIKMVRSFTAEDPFADDADEEVDAVVSESIEENFLFA